MTTAAAARECPIARQKRREQHARRRERLMLQAREQYAQLIEKLGGRCCICEEDGTTAPLSIDHVAGLAWDKRHNRYRFDTRVRKYVAEYAAGVPLRVLCVPCNSARGRPDEEDLDAAPF